MSNLGRVRLWVPESDYDAKAVFYIATKIVEFYQCQLEIVYSDKRTFNDVARKPGGLEKAVNTYLKKVDSIIFLIDSDGRQSQAQRSKESNSLVNQIKKIVNSTNGKAKLILMVQELEAWLLVDCLGICCYFTKKPETRHNQKWINFASGIQIGQTHLIAEAESGGNGAKEQLIETSKKILINKNPKLKDQDLKKIDMMKVNLMKLLNL